MWNIADFRSQPLQVQQSIHMPDLPTQPDPVDLAIVGGGPTGLFAAFYAGLRGMSVKIIDSLPTLGGQLATLYPEKFIYDVAGFQKVMAKDLVARLTEQGLQFGAVPALDQQVSDLVHDAVGRHYVLKTSKAAHRARAILIAGGVGAFSPKTLALADAPKYVGRGLHYFVQHVEELRGKRLLIVGGGDSAVDWVNTLSPIASRITLIHRRDVFRAHEEAVSRMRQTPTDIRLFHELVGIGGQNQIETAIVRDSRAGCEAELAVDAVLVNIGFNNSLGPIKDWGLDIEGGQIKVDGMMQTARPGIFAAGDICVYPGKLKLIATGFGEACVAVNYAKHYLDPAANIFPGHSTNLRGRG
jgi:thioredoxin reductase (NADPH)